MSSNKHKEKLYKEIIKKLEEDNIVFLLGKKRWGKTALLKKIEQNYKNAIYIDFKGIEDVSSMDAVSAVVKSIEEDDEEVLYLLDHYHEAFFPKWEVERIADAWWEKETHKTKIVFTGNSSSISSIGAKPFGHDYYVRMQFPTFEEYFLSHNCKIEEMEEMFVGYMYNINEFYGGIPLKEYLQECMEEAEICNLKNNTWSYGNTVEDLTVEILVDVLSCYLLSKFKLPMDTTCEQIIMLDEYSIKQALEFLIYRNFMQLDFERDKIENIYKVITGQR